MEQVKTRRVRDQGMIDAGQIKDPKALERMLGELDSLNRRINSLEDTELEVMERLETAQISLDERSAELAAMDGEEAELRSAFEKKAGDLQTELAAAQAGTDHDRRRMSRTTCWRSTRSCASRRPGWGRLRFAGASAVAAGSR